MLARLLVAVLTLVGAVPLRVCTCATADHHHDAPSHDSLPFTESDAGTDRNPVAAADSPPDSHHDPECPAVEPRAAMAVAVPPIVASVPTHDLPGVALPDPPRSVAAAGHAPRGLRPPDPRRPLFLILLVLRN